MGGQGDLVVYLDNLSLVGPQPTSELPIQELITNGSFASGLAPWWTGGNLSARTAGGALQVTINDGGANPWNAIVGQNNVPILLGGRYTLRFVAWASRNVTVTVLIQRNGAPFTQYFNSRLPLTTTPQTFTYTFTSVFEDEGATLQFQIGGGGAFTFNVDDVTLRGPRPAPPVQHLTVVRANQVGYLPRAPKRATIAIEATGPQVWTLFDSDDAAVASGTTTVLGTDAASGELLHTADFSSFEQPGAGYTNLAAVAAQGARIWRQIDHAFAQRCLTAAETAWTAASTHPAMFARDSFLGGGGYGDDDVSDELYWAAAELFVTTGKRTYAQFIGGSPHFLSIPVRIDAKTGVARGSSLGWPSTEALGTISLALAPPRLSVFHVLRVRQNILRAADGYAAAAAREPYGLPYSSSGGYHWGSNAEVLNNSLILGLAHDITGDRKYLDAISSGMDYLLGRNPNVKSYIAGWGERAMQNPHHRFWAPSVGPAFPPPPPGALAGGPNQNLQDPHVQTLFAGGCAPQTCYADHRDTYSTNEVAINWNAALAWVAARLDDPRLKQP